MRSLLTLLFVIPVLLGRGQTQCFEFFPTSALSCAHETPDYLWLGTEEDGVIRFDKATSEMTYWNSSNSELPFDEIKSIATFDDDLLISADSVIVTFNEGMTTVLTDTIGGHLRINDQDDLIIAGNFAFVTWNGTQVTDYQQYIGLLNESCPICDHVTDIALDGDQMWLSHFGFYEFDILQNNNGDWSNWDWSNTPAGVFPIESWNEYNGITSKDGLVLATSWGGLKMYDQQTWSTLDVITEDSDTMQYGFNGICFDQLEGHWVGGIAQWPTMASGRLAYSDGDSWQIFEPFEQDSVNFHRLYPSPFQNTILYGLTSHGLLIVDKGCLGITSLPELEAPNLIVYPNPSSSNIQFTRPVYEAVTVYSLDGRIMKVEDQPPVSQINLSGMSPGGYVLRSASGRLNARIIVSRK